MSREIEVRLHYFINNLTTQQYILGLSQDTTLQQLSQYLFYQIAAIKQPQALYSLSNKDPKMIPQKTKIKDLAKGNPQLMLYVIEADKAKASGKKCCLLF